MVKIEPPFIDNGEGFPTKDSAQAALGMFSLDKLASVPTSYRDPEGTTHEGTITDLITHCRIEHLVRGWPRGFISHVVGAATQAAEGLPES